MKSKERLANSLAQIAGKNIAITTIKKNKTNTSSMNMKRGQLKESLSRMQSSASASENIIKTPTTQKKITKEEHSSNKKKRLQSNAESQDENISDTQVEENIKKRMTKA